MSRHLPLLQAMFPGQIVLSVDQIAKCLNLSKGHIYNLSSAKDLPFNPVEGKGGLQVSIIAMADYLDSTLEPKVVEDRSIPVPDLIVAKRRGRPRGSVTRRQMAFQSALALAIVRHEVETTFEELLGTIEEIALPDGAGSCSERFDHSKSEIEASVAKARSTLFASVLSLGLPPTHSQSNRFVPKL